MSSTRSSINFSIILLSLVNWIFSKPKQRKTYDYTGFVCGRDYVFERVDNMPKGYMTGYGKGIKGGDYIILPNGSDSNLYQVEEIDYYSDPPDMWIALLTEGKD